MPLKRLTALEKLRIEEERDSLVVDIEEFEKILKSEVKRRTLVLHEPNEAVEKFGQPRRTEIISPDDIPVFEVTEEPEDVVEEPCVVTLSTSGQIGRTPVDGARRATRADMTYFQRQYLPALLRKLQPSLPRGAPHKSLLRTF